jgi:ferredoxin
VQDEKGFYAPLINKQICTECGLCEKKCPVLHPVVKNGIDQYGFACWSNNPITRKESSSGGFFTEAAKTVLAKDGVIAGAAFDKKFIVRHEIIDNEIDLITGFRWNLILCFHFSIGCLKVYVLNWLHGLL